VTDLCCAWVELYYPSTKAHTNTKETCIQDYSMTFQFGNNLRGTESCNKKADHLDEKSKIENSFRNSNFSWHKRTYICSRTHVMVMSDVDHV